MPAANEKREGGSLPWLHTEAAAAAAAAACSSGLRLRERESGVRTDPRRDCDRARPTTTKLANLPSLFLQFFSFSPPLQHLFRRLDKLLLLSFSRRR